MKNTQMRRNFDFADEAFREKQKGIKRHRYRYNQVETIWTELTKDDPKSGKRRGHYITLAVENLDRETIFFPFVRALHRTLRRLLHQHHYRRNQKILVVGLGNSHYRSDALGPRSVEHMCITKHLTKHRAFADAVSVASIAPGVMADTGMESARIVRALVQEERFDFVIAIDSLATTSLSRLYKAIQICDVGLVPGSGLGAKRQGITAEFLGCPVIAIGVATVVESAAMIFDVLQSLVPEHTLGYHDIREVLHDEHHNYVMTSKDIERTIDLLSEIVQQAIDLTFNPWSVDEVRHN